MNARYAEAERIRAAAPAVAAAQTAVHEAYAKRAGTSAGLQRWEAAVSAFRRAWERMYPPDFGAAVAACRTDARAIDRVITFLEVDPWCDQSGYVKERILHRLKAAPLSEAQVVRLRQVVLSAVDAGDRREFRSYCRLASRIVDEALYQALLDRLRDANPGIARRALWMLDRTDRSLGADDRAVAWGILAAQLTGDLRSWRSAYRWVIPVARHVGGPAWVDELAARISARVTAEAIRTGIIPSSFDRVDDAPA